MTIIDVKTGVERVVRRRRRSVRGSRRARRPSVRRTAAARQNAAAVETPARSSAPDLRRRTLEDATTCRTSMT